MRVGTFNRIAGAGFCAALATYLTVSYVIPASTKPPAVVVHEVRPVTPPDTKTVIVAAVPLRPGTVITPDVLADVQWPAASVPPGTFSNREDLLSKGGPRTVIGAIGKAEPILAAKVTEPGQRGTLSAVIDDGKRAMTIRVDDVLVVQPDDRVDVLHMRDDRPALASAQAAASPYATVLLQNVRVLATDQVGGGAQAKPAKTVTIEVTQQEAQKVYLAQKVGQLGLILRPVGSSSTSAVRPVDLDDIGGQKRRRDASADNADGSTFVAVTRGANNRSEYEFTAAGRRQVRQFDRGQQDSQGGDRDAVAAKPE